MTIEASPVLDCLYICRTLDRLLGKSTDSEIHLLAYLACLLWVYEKRPIADWGYEFVGTELGAPYSDAIQRSLEQLVFNGFLSKHDEFLHLDSSGLRLLEQLESLESTQERREALEGACSGVLAMPIGFLREALSRAPGLKNAVILRLKRRLLDESSMSQIYEQFAMLREALGAEEVDLMVPAVVWIESIYRSSAMPGT